MKSSARLIATGLASVLLLAGCSGGKPDTQKAEDDPAATSALSDEIMVDPELAGQQGQDVSRIGLPPEQRTPEAIAAARAEALKLVGGEIRSAPEPASSGAGKLIEQAATAAQVAKAAGKTDCSTKVAYSAKWANSLPDALAVYPRGAVQEAAGTDTDGCRLRVVSFLTPVKVNEVIDFYYTRLRAAGYDASHRLDGKDHVLGGGKGKTAYLVFARTLDNGLTEVDLVAGG